MPYVSPTISAFKDQFGRDFPFATPAEAPSGVVLPILTAVTNGVALTGITITSPGSGMANKTTTLVIYGGGGLGAKATITIAGGICTAVNILSLGVGYTIAPSVYVPVPGQGDNTNVEKFVTDPDIARAIVMATAFNMTQSLFSSQAAFTTAYNLLSAHYLVETLQAGGTGLNGKAEWLTKSKTVGSVSEDFEIPDRVLKSPYLGKLSKTTYGAQFLELVSPQLIGNVQSFRGQTNP